MEDEFECIAVLLTYQRLFLLHCCMCIHIKLSLALIHALFCGNISATFCSCKLPEKLSGGVIGTIQTATILHLVKLFVCRFIYVCYSLWRWFHDTVPLCFGKYYMPAEIKEEKVVSLESHDWINLTLTLPSPAAGVGGSLTVTVA